MSTATVATPAETTQQKAERATEVKKRITNEQLAQEWTSYALQLPENERALADRMKIIVPAMVSEDTFSISVDNHLAKEMFVKESDRILKGISKDLGDSRPRMVVNVNKVALAQLCVAP